MINGDHAAADPSEEASMADSVGLLHPHAR
jgi:hypothetical protein